ncbi:phosphoserine aminotransferase, putative [Toxoplasma gondii ME49]|uniref:phosphoserine transaminase n=2 Tax=Toxoplasma gondii TaxID=5811 RepID=S8EN29_TOXGM|nr:phosphoserine aminotransferase, putative [Toxoplasma gondii ME49]EPT24661.1 phosphoserine aminotransferase, putative [Toxoplasma gondii ME49]KYF48735.1 putative phosphoserine aminotransferase [Toxoplasma gondii ARI]|eukprot:XP_018634827.1 phosphoserine aminotransferase, putative [Toxoplasma gondii ME49]
MEEADLSSLAATERQQVLPFGRVVNFAPGPACLPVEVLLETQRDLLNWRGCGMSVLEMSHRGRYYRKMMEETKGNLSSLLELPSSHHLLFMQGGATLQFAAQPLNMLRFFKDTADYVITGNWSAYAFKEAGKYGNMRVAADTKANGFVDLPPVSEWTLNPNAAYVHYCDNETVYGVEFPRTPNLSEAQLLSPEEVPLFSSPSSLGSLSANGHKEGGRHGDGDASFGGDSNTKLRLTSDMSSNFCSRPIDIDAHALIVAGAQKNIGPAGVTIVIARDDILGKELDVCPSMCSYALCKNADSALNTPPVFSMYMVGLMAKYLRKQGGLAAWSEVCEAKAKKIYDAIEESDFFVCPVARDARSRINVRFSVVGPSLGEEYEREEEGGEQAGGAKKEKNRAEDVELAKKFLREAEERGLYHLEGHRTLGGCRVSLYTGMPMEGVEALVQFMKEFAEENGDASPEAKKPRREQREPAKSGNAQEQS